MGKKDVVRSLLLVLIMLFISLSLIGLPSDAAAQKGQKMRKGVSYNVDENMGRNLKAMEGRRISITLDSGKTFSGIVKKVGRHLIHLEKLDGKEYYDALIRIDKIMAIDARFRKFR